MERPPFTAFHRPVILAGVHGPDELPLADWTPSWHTACLALAHAGLAFYVNGILVIAPIATIKMEVNYEA